MLKESTGAKQNPTNLSDLPENRKSVDKREDTPVCNCNKSEHKSASNLNDVSYKDVQDKTEFDECKTNPINERDKSSIIVADQERKKVWTNILVRINDEAYILTPIKNTLQEEKSQNKEVEFVSPNQSSVGMTVGGSCYSTISSITSSPYLRVKCFEARFKEKTQK